MPFSRSSPAPRFQLSPPICRKRKSMYMFQVSCVTQSLFSNTMFFSFYVPSHMHLQIRCASSNDFSVLMVLIQCLFSFIHIGFFFTIFKESVGFVSFISPMQHSHIHTVFKHYHEQDAMIEKQKFVQCHH